MGNMLKKPLALYSSAVGVCLLLHWSLLAGLFFTAILISTAITFTIARIVTEIRLANGGIIHSIDIPNASMVRMQAIRTAIGTMMINPDKRNCE